MKPTTVALLGLRDTGKELLAAILADGRLSLVAVADSDGETVRRHTDGTDLRAYTDFRSLVTEASRAGLDALFVAVAPHQSIEYVRLAAARGVAVFHESPPARTVSEAAGLAEAFRVAGKPLVVSRPWLVEPVLGPLRQPADVIDRVCAAAVSVRVSGTSAGWHGDKARAGGGVLLHGAYECLDMLVHIMGMPKAVVAHRILAGPPGVARNYDTEDVMQLLLTFTEDRSAVFTASREAVEPGSRVLLLGLAGSIELRDDELVIRRHGGEQHVTRPLPPGPRSAPAVGAFSAALASDCAQTATTIEAHLHTLATIEAAYLSAKTGAAESPENFLKRS